MSCLDDFLSSSLNGLTAALSRTHDAGSFRSADPFIHPSRVRVAMLFHLSPTDRLFTFSSVSVETEWKTRASGACGDWQKEVMGETMMMGSCKVIEAGSVRQNENSSQPERQTHSRSRVDFFCRPEI